MTLKQEQTRLINEFIGLTEVQQEQRSKWLAEFARTFVNENADLFPILLLKMKELEESVIEVKQFLKSYQ